MKEKEGRKQQGRKKERKKGKEERKGRKEGKEAEDKEGEKQRNVPVPIAPSEVITPISLPTEAALVVPV